jgi:hypothetical protein
MSVQNDYTGYVSIAPVNSPTASGTQHPHGYAGILLAASAMDFPLVVMPVRFTSFTAHLSAKDVILNWKNEDDKEANYYEVQYSANGVDFTGIAQIKSTGSGIYNYVHQDGSGAIRYYRIKAVSTDGSILYSTTLIVRMQDDHATIDISPNPAGSGAINVRFENMEPGMYTLTIINTTGIKVLEKKFQILTRSSVEMKAVLPYLGKGLYYVKTAAQGFLNTKTILIN